MALAEAGQALFVAITTAQGQPGTSVAETIARAERAVEMTRSTGDPLAESAALDVLTGAFSWAGDTFGAATTAKRRIGLLSSAPATPAATHELIEALGEAAEASLGTGDLLAARRWAGQLADHPLLAEVGHRAVSWLLVADALAGNVRAGTDRQHPLPRRVAAGGRTRADVPRPRGGRRGDGPRPPRRPGRQAGVAGGPRSAWGTHPERTYGYGAVFDAMLLLHHGQLPEAMERTAVEPSEVWKWVTWIWHHWYVALRAEAAVLAGSPDARARVAEAQGIVAGNPVASAMVERAAALLDGDQEALLATVSAFDAAGCPYQSARTTLLAGGSECAADCRWSPVGSVPWMLGSAFRNSLIRSSCCATPTTGVRRRWRTPSTTRSRTSCGG